MCSSVFLPFDPVLLSLALEDLFHKTFRLTRRRFVLRKNRFSCQRVNGNFTLVKRPIRKTRDVLVQDHPLIATPYLTTPSETRGDVKTMLDRMMICSKRRLHDSEVLLDLFGREPGPFRGENSFSDQSDQWLSGCGNVGVGVMSCRRRRECEQVSGRGGFSGRAHGAGDAIGIVDRHSVREEDWILFVITGALYEGEFRLHGECQQEPAWPPPCSSPIYSPGKL